MEKTNWYAGIDWIPQIKQGV